MISQLDAAPHLTAPPALHPHMAEPKLTHQPVHLLSVSPELWRVLDAKGRVLGHLQAIDRGEALRYAARRFHAPTRSFRELGEFWSADDAIDCLRFAR